MISRARTALLVVVVVVTVASVAYLTNPTAVPGSTDGYERATPTVVDDETDETLAAVNARVADTRAKRFTNLNDTESLAENGGVWSVHNSSDTYAYVVCGMDLPLNVVLVVENGTITRIHHTKLDPEGASESDLARYRGTGKYILKPPYSYTNETGINVGDRVEVGQKRNARRVGNR